MKTKALDKCLRYIQQNINSGNWKPNEGIPTLSNIAMTLNASTITVRKAISILEKDKIIDNQGSFGFILRSNLVTFLNKKRNITRFYLSELNNSVKALSLLRDGGQRIGQFIVKCDDIKVTFINVNDSIIRNTTLEELHDLIWNPTNLKSIVNLKGRAFNTAMAKWTRQNSLIKIAEVVTKNEKQLRII